MIASGGPDCPTEPFLLAVSSPSRRSRRTSQVALNKYILPFDERLATEQVFSRRWTILPKELANLPCTKSSPSTLLSWLNTIFETNLAINATIEACLTEFIDDGCDIGQVYGYLRPWWTDIGDMKAFGTLLGQMRARRQKDYELRSTAITGNRITNSRIPPRRVWDLYANRVVPFYALQPTVRRGKEHIPSNLWAVSHSWRASSERQSVLTTINGKAWHVPIPRGTTLNDVRNELLMLGAEYVFLDVLCLRQKDQLLPESESIRKREWRLDIPTIGHIYNEDEDRPVIVYFNGLGLPFSDQPVDPNDSYHWFSRVWTLQETPVIAIFGGLEHKLGKVDLYDLSQWPSEIRRDFLEPFAALKAQWTGIEGALRIMRSRSYSNPVDQVACLAYLLRCPTLPIYDADMDVELAWSLLVECLPPKVRAELLFSYFGPRRPSGSWRPTWEQVKACTRFQYPLGWTDDERLRHVDGAEPSLGYRHEFDACYHRAYVVEECRVRVAPPPTRRRGAKEPDVSAQDGISLVVEMPPAKGKRYPSYAISDYGDSIEMDIPYVLISIGFLENWVVAEVEGVRRINGERALEVSKVSTLTIPESNQFNNANKFKKHVKGTYQLVVYR